MASAGLSVKERLALLQNNSNTNGSNNNGNNPPGSSLKPSPGGTPKPKPSPTEAKPPGPVGFRPVTPSKPVAPGHKPVTADKPGGSDKPGTPNKPVTPNKPNKPVTANKPVTPDSKPITATKPGFTSKPAAAVKPFTTTSPTTLGAGDPPSTNESDTPLFPKLRPVGTPSTPKQPNSTREAAGGETPAPHSSTHETGGPDSSSSATMKEKTSIVSPIKPVSVQERLAALRQKCAGDDGMEAKPKEHDSSFRSPTSSTPKPAPAFSPSTTSGVLKPVNSAQSDSSGPTPGFPGFKRSDIAKSLNQAADRILRSKAAAGSSEEEAKAPRHFYQRRCDGKKFRKLDVASVTSSKPAPAKPRGMDNVDLKSFLQAYAAAKEEKLKVDGGDNRLPGEADDGGDMDEMYVEAESTSVPIRSRKGSSKLATSMRVSLIPEFTEEEEEEELYTDGSSGARLPPPEEPEMYDDCQSTVEQSHQRREPPPSPDDPEEIYEPLDDDLPPQHELADWEHVPPPLPSPNTPDDKKNREKEEAAKKRDRAKEEANKKEEKERKKKEEDLKKMKRKFGLNESDEKVGDGVVKSSAGGGVFSKDLAVVTGEIIAILRIDGNPAGKWLVQNELGKIGFVNSNNIEISTPTIRNLMAGVKHETGGEEPDDTYEALPEGEMDEIYEEL